MFLGDAPDRRAAKPAADPACIGVGDIADKLCR
jgi:hypothetical protein